MFVQLMTKNIPARMQDLYNGYSNTIGQLVSKAHCTVDKSSTLLYKGN